MPEPITIGLIVAALVAGFSKKIGENAVEPLWEKCKQILKGDETITIFPQVYDSANKHKELETKLDEKLAYDPAARHELEELFRQLPQQVKQNIMNITGDGNVGIQDVSGSTININK
jgi:hypothetical protein